MRVARPRHAHSGLSHGSCVHPRRLGVTRNPAAMPSFHAGTFAAPGEAADVAGACNRSLRRSASGSPTMCATAR